MTMQTPAPLARLPLMEGNEPVAQIAHYDALILDPPYQRGSVWGPTRQRNLIRSLMQGIPTGAVYLNVRDGDDIPVAVVDGKQRIETVRAFLAGNLSVPASWFADEYVAATVTTLDGPYVTFNGLTEVGQRRFERARFTVLRSHLSTVEEEAALFELVNYGGLAQGDTDEDRAVIDDTCDGSGWVILNPQWPAGTLPHRERCAGCTRCDPDGERDW